LGQRPDPPVAIGGLDVALGHLLAEGDGIGHAFIAAARTIPINVELVHRAIPVVPLGVFYDDRSADFRDLGIIAGWRLGAEQRLELDRREFAVALFG